MEKCLFFLPSRKEELFKVLYIDLAFIVFLVLLCMNYDVCEIKSKKGEIIAYGLFEKGQLVERFCACELNGRYVLSRSANGERRNFGCIGRFFDERQRRECTGDDFG